MINYTTAFHSRLLKITDVSDAEALARYINGLKQGTKNWVLICDISSLNEKAKWVEWYNNTYCSCSKNNQTSSNSALVFEKQC